MVVLHLGLTVLAMSAAAQSAVAPAPLYRDPVHDGATDPALIYDAGKHQWLMFYTSRRADVAPEEKGDVRWIHGTKIGVAESPDGVNWKYRADADIPAACTGATLWAPELGRYGGLYHMWLTVVPGVFKDWNASRSIVHLTSRDLVKWDCHETLNLGSDRVIDASVVEVQPNQYRIWFKDERDGSRIKFYDSNDLEHWTPGGTAIQSKGEGAKVFRWRDRWWMISDAWKGLLVSHSPDTKTWTQQDEYLLAQPGTRPTDRAMGHHADVVVSGDRAFLYYFVHQGDEPDAKNDPLARQRSVVQVTELHEADGKITVDRNSTTEFSLRP